MCSTAGTVLQELTGEEFDADFLKQPTLWKVDWWAKRTPRDSVGHRTLVRQMLDDLRAHVEDRRPNLSARGQGWWDNTGRSVVQNLEMILNAYFPFGYTENVPAQIRQIERIERWWQENLDSLAGMSR